MLDDPRGGPFVAAAVRQACHASPVAAEVHALSTNDATATWAIAPHPVLRAGATTKNNESS